MTGTSERKKTRRKRFADHERDRHHKTCRAFVKTSILSQPSGPYRACMSSGICHRRRPILSKLKRQATWYSSTWSNTSCRSRLFVRVIMHLNDVCGRGFFSPMIVRLRPRNTDMSATLSAYHVRGMHVLLVSCG
jgi:hypothetical protein